MAKTLLEGSAYADSQSDLTAIYTCPSDKYAKITILYFGDNDSPEGFIQELGPNGSSRYAKLFISHHGSNGFSCVIGGAYPFSGIGYGSFLSYGNFLPTVHYSNFDGNLIVPPSAIVKVSASYQRDVAYSMLIEEIDKTTIEA